MTLLMCSSKPVRIPRDYFHIEIIAGKKKRPSWGDGLERVCPEGLYKLESCFLFEIKLWKEQLKEQMYFLFL